VLLNGVLKAVVRLNSVSGVFFVLESCGTSFFIICFVKGFFETAVHLNDLGLV
jgi:hypothetical protein